MGSELRIGIIGVGRIGRFHLETCHETPGFSVVAACDPSVEARDAVRGRVEVYESLDQMLESEALDAAFVCTPPGRHFAVTTACLRQGLPVLCEKPFGTDTVDAAELLRLSVERHTPVALASKFRHVPDIGRAMELLWEGAIGSLVHVEIEFCDRVDMADRWNSIPSQSGGGVIVDAGSHAFDLLQFVAGPPHRIQAARMKQVQPFAVEDGALLQVEMRDRATASVRVSWSLPADGRPLLCLRGTQGVIAVGWRESWLLARGRDRIRFGDGYNKREAHRRMYQRFRAVLTRGAEPWITEEEVLAISHAIESAYASLETKGWVDLPVQHSEAIVDASWGR